MSEVRKLENGVETGYWTFLRRAETQVSSPVDAWLVGCKLWCLHRRKSSHQNRNFAI